MSTNASSIARMALRRLQRLIPADPTGRSSGKVLRNTSRGTRPMSSSSTVASSRSGMLRLADWRKSSRATMFVAFGMDVCDFDPRTMPGFTREERAGLPSGCSALSTPRSKTDLGIQAARALTRTLRQRVFWRTYLLPSEDIRPIQVCSSVFALRSLTRRLRSARKSPCRGEAGETRELSSPRFRYRFGWKTRVLGTRLRSRCPP